MAGVSPPSVIQARSWRTSSRVTRTTLFELVPAPAAMPTRQCLLLSMTQTGEPLCPFVVSAVVDIVRRFSLALCRMPAAHHSCLPPFPPGYPAVYAALPLSVRGSSRANTVFAPHLGLAQ